MSLEEYVSYRFDLFQIDRNKLKDKEFPCIMCIHSDKSRKDKPCIYCGYNEQAEECYNCSLCGEIQIGSVLINSNVIASNTQAEIGGICDKCYTIIKKEIKGEKYG